MDNVDKSVYNSLFSSFTSQKLWITIKNAKTQPTKDFPNESSRETPTFTRKKELEVQSLFPNIIIILILINRAMPHQKIRLTASTFR